VIIDVHGHYTTAPKALEDWRNRQIAGLKDPAIAPKASELAISDDDLRASIEANQLAKMKARGSDLIMKSAEKMRMITQHVERSSQEQARGGKQITTAIEQISTMVNGLNTAQKTHMRGTELVDAVRRVDEAIRSYDQQVERLSSANQRLQRALSVLPG